MSKRKEDLENSEIKTNDNPVRWFGYIILFLTFGVFGIWSYFAPIDSAAIAPGYVAVKYNSKTVQDLEGGIVKAIHVQDGVKVNKNDILIELDDTQIRAQKEIVLSQYISSKALEERLLAEQKGQKKLTFTNYLPDSTDARVEEANRVQNDIFIARKKSREGQKQVLEQRIEQLESKYSGLIGQKKSNQQLEASYAEEITEQISLLKQGFADKQHLRELQRQQTNLIGQIAELEAELATIKIQIGETRLQIIQISKEFDEKVANQLSQVQIELSGLTEKLTAIDDRLERTLVRAPVSGTVISLTVHTQGGVVSPGSPILTIVPTRRELTISAQISPMDIDRVHKGLIAEVRFSVFHQKSTPKLTGKVINLSADRLINKQSGHPYYLAEIELLPESVRALDKLELLPGMPAEVLISTGERTLFQYLSKPVTEAFVRSFKEE